MNKRFFLAAFILIAQVSFAQLKQLSMTDAMVNAKTTLAPENLKQLQFIRETNDYIYLKKNGDQEIWMTGNYNNSEKEYLSRIQLNESLRKAGMDTVMAMPPIQFSKNSFTTTIKSQKLLFKEKVLDKILISKEIAAKENVEESSAGYIAYLDEHNLYVSGNNKIVKVTEDGSNDIVYASTVHQSEFGITKGTFWSNNGKLLAFYRMDQSMTPDYPIIDWTERPAKVNNLRYPMAGDSSHHVRVGIYNAETGSTTWVKTSGPNEQFLTNIAWSPDDQFVYIVIVNREQNQFWVNQYNAATGDFIKTLFEEQDEKYAEPLVPMLFVKKNPNQFIWQSKRDGWNHLYLYNIDGKIIKQLTKGEWEVIEVKGFDDKGENLFYVSTAISPVSKNLFKVNLASGKELQITQGNNVHNTQISYDGKFIIDNFSSPENPRTIQLMDLANKKTKLIKQAIHPLAEFELGKMNIFTIKNADGTDLYCRLYKPVQFDSNKKYPVIVYWYGGPHAQLILNGWNGGAGDYWFQYMAERGYIVFTLDTRGSSNRGKAFEQSIFRRAGEKQMEDLLSGIDYLKRLAFVDNNNMGLFGWSYGGFMTIDFMLKHPGIFKAAVAGGPVTDWRYYEIMYTERYMDKPQENPEGYESTNLVNQIDKLKGKLLLIHGMQDNVVLMQHSVNLVKAAVDKGVQVDYMIYPGHEHNVLGKDRAHLYQKVTDYFLQNLSH